jgi:hypothetical protein
MLDPLLGNRFQLRMVTSFNELGDCPKYMIALVSIGSGGNTDDSASLRSLL